MISKISNKFFGTSVIAILALTTVVLMTGCGSSGLGLAASPQNNPLRVIPYPEGIELGGAAAYNGANDHPHSRYFVTDNDWFEQENTRDLVILPHFATYQQTTSMSCGPAVVLMTLYHYGRTDKNELQLIEELSQNEQGVGADAIRDYFLAQGFQVDSHVASEPRFQKLAEFTEFVRTQLQAGRPILVDWLRWEGHWTIIIGLDTLGTDSPTDDILIMADPFDISDHRQDGYFVVHALEFYAEWVEGYCGDYTNTTPPYRQAMIVPYLSVAN